MRPVPQPGPPAGEGQDPPGKHPRSVHAGPGPRDYSWKPLACRTHQEVDERFGDDGQYATANLMLAIPAGMMVIDQDNDDGGHQAIAELAERLGELPPTVGHQTPHGEHRIYRTLAGWTGRAWVGKDARNPLPPGIDLRMPGQILMAPPSRAPGAGGQLEYGPPSGKAVAGLPATYLAAWTPPKPAARPTARPVPVAPDAAERAASYVHKTITGILADLVGHKPGGRNTAIYTAALKAGSVLGAARSTPGAEHAADGWTDETAEDAIMGAAVQNYYVDTHGAAMAQSAIRSGLRNGLRNPRALPDFATKPQAEPGRHPANPALGNTPPRHAVAARATAMGRHTDPGPGQPQHAAATSAAAVELRHSGEIIRVISEGQDVGRIYRDQGPRGTFYRPETASGPQCTATDREVGRHLASIDHAASAIIAANSHTAAAPPGEIEMKNRENDSRMRANRAAVAANEAYRAGNLDQAASTSTGPSRWTPPGLTCGSGNAPRSPPSSYSSTPGKRRPTATTPGRRNSSRTPDISTPGCRHSGTVTCPDSRPRSPRPAPMITLCQATTRGTPARTPALDGQTGLHYAVALRPGTRAWPPRR